MQYESLNNEQRGIRSARLWVYERASTIRSSNPYITQVKALKQAWREYRAMGNKRNKS